MVSEDALKELFKYTNEQWTVKPKYILLIGDSTWDLRNYAGYGNFNLVPSKHINLIEMESASDDSLVDFDDDGFAELAIGRIPARSAAQVNNALAKTIDYETSQQSLAVEFCLLTTFRLGMISKV